MCQFTVAGSRWALVVDCSQLNACTFQSSSKQFDEAQQDVVRHLMVFVTKSTQRFCLNRDQFRLRTRGPDSGRPIGLNKCRPHHEFAGHQGIDGPLFAGSKRVLNVDFTLYHDVQLIRLIPLTKNCIASGIRFSSATMAICRSRSAFALIKYGYRFNTSGEIMTLGSLHGYRAATN